MMKSCVKRILFFCLLMGILLLFVQGASAASMKRIHPFSGTSEASRTVGGACFLADSEGNLTVTKNNVTKTISTKFAPSYILSDGETVYFPEKESERFYLIWYELDTDYRKTMGKMGSPAYSVDLAGYYNNKVYFIMDVPDGVLACLNLGSGKTKKLATQYLVSVAEQNGRYFLLADGTGAGFSYLGVLDATTDKVKEITKDPHEWVPTSKYVYYMAVKKGLPAGGYPFTVSICRYQFSNGNNKTLVKKVTVYGIRKFTTTYLQYKDAKGKWRKISWKK